MKKLFSFAIMAMFASAISAQVKVVSNGNVKMSKDLTVSGVTKIKLVNENDVTVRPLSMVGTPSNKIANLNPILFKAMDLRPQGNGTTLETNSIESTTEAVLPQSDLVMKDHYGFAISEVRRQYPELVETDENGNSYVNYTELIPIMVQAIKELTIQVEELQNELSLGSASSPMMAPAHTGINNNNILSECILYQNTPNPFNERTMIRFSLPSEVKDAYIYVFDMQGVLKKQLRANAGIGYITIEASEFEAGMYLYSLIVNGKEVATKRMILSK